MLAAELNHPKLLELQPEAGRIQFAGRRAILVDVQAMGLLRRYLVDNLGYAAARTMLTQLGFAHGHRMAEMAKIDVSWRNEVERLMAGPRMLELQGLFQIEPNGHELLSEAGMTILGSFEAEEQVGQFGRAASPSCWWTCGVLSGYLTASSELPICVIEDRCVSMGHAACHLTARPKELWGPTHAEALRSFGDTPLAEFLDDTLKSVTQRLKATEQHLDARW
jgi:two-component system, NtrC family, response regulator HydG